MQLPRFIGICGHPKSGKSLVQDILEDSYGVTPIDDGWPGRAFAMEFLGLSHDDVYSQAGKAAFTVVNGKTWQNRDILGSYMKALEDLFGTDIVHHMSCLDLPAAGSFSFGSVRRNAAAIKKAGGIIIAVRNPKAPPSPFEFDGFDESLVDIWIDNDAQERGLGFEAGKRDLEQKIAAALRVSA